MKQAEAMRLAELKLDVQALARQAKETGKVIEAAKKTIADRKRKGMPIMQKTAAGKKSATFKVTYIPYVHLTQDESQDRALEKNLAAQIGNREIVYITRLGTGDFQIITREAN